MDTSPDTAPDLVDRYFARAVDPDPSGYFALFAADAVVEDDGHVHRGIDAIRAWRTSVPPVRYDVRATTTAADGATVARVEVSGDFPGSPIDLTHTFGVTVDGRIGALTIRV